MFNQPAKTVLRGIAKTRKGSLPIGVHRLAERAKMSAFADELLKLAAQEVDPHEAIDAAKTLTYGSKGRGRRVAEAGVLSGMAAPAIQIAGHAARGYMDASKGGRLAGAMGAVKGLTKGDHAKAIIGGGLGAATIAASREGLQHHKARKTFQAFMQQQGVGQ